jgi:Phage integrase, N-terminal SAM-like domain
MIAPTPGTMAWLREHRPRLEEGTYRDYRNHADRRLTPFFGAMRLSDISPADVRRYVARWPTGSVRERGGRRVAPIGSARWPRPWAS